MLFKKAYLNRKRKRLLFFMKLSHSYEGLLGAISGRTYAIDKGYKYDRESINV